MTAPTIANPSPSIAEAARSLSLPKKKLRSSTPSRSDPNPESLSEQIEQAGFTDVDVAVELAAIRFENGRDFLEDPIARLVVGPDVRCSLPTEAGLEEAWSYLTDAVSKYWSEITFELTVNIGCASARKAELHASA